MRVGAECVGAMRDEVVIEEPLEIIMEWFDGDVRTRRTLSITMRTPGHDEELAAGFLFGEGIVRERSDVVAIVSCGAIGGRHRGQNAVRVTLARSLAHDWPRFERHVYASSSCGICGRASIEALDVDGRERPNPDGFVMAASTLVALPERVRAMQRTFDRTGGLHAAALANAVGEIVAVREDVGRHNAVDKVLGARFIAGETDLSAMALILSGRASFELVQKALAARIPLVASVGAPSSLAIDLAQRFDMTLVGFVRDGRCNVYSTPQRVIL
ncbi:MAG: formate dehydrogenase accessory sulfurtransferase FdhD [Phycisphaerales bacterium]|nr:formate dehydrogenase accessory sulfurtransferase FdhD [Phycisphaerales bacterium]